MSCCDGLSADEYLNGLFKTNHTVASNQLAILRQARHTLWQAMHGFRSIHIINLQFVKHVYMDNETFEHRRLLLGDLDGFMRIQPIFRSYDQQGLNVLLAKNSTIEAQSESKSILINSLLKGTYLRLEKNAIVVDSNFASCKLTVGENTYLSDLNIVTIIRLKNNINFF